jgi:hypothetical protein
MPKFEVYVTELWTRRYRWIEANSEEEAIRYVAENELPLEEWADPPTLEETFDPDGTIPSPEATAWSAVEASEAEM